MPYFCILLCINYLYTHYTINSRNYELKIAELSYYFYKSCTGGTKTISHSQWSSKDYCTILKHSRLSCFPLGFSNYRSFRTLLRHKTKLKHFHSMIPFPEGLNTIDMECHVRWIFIWGAMFAECLYGAPYSLNVYTNVCCAMSTECLYVAPCPLNIYMVRRVCWIFYGTPCSLDVYIGRQVGWMFICSAMFAGCLYGTPGWLNVYMGRHVPWMFIWDARLAECLYRAPCSLNVYMGRHVCWMFIWGAMFAECLYVAQCSLNVYMGRQVGWMFI